MNTQQVIDLIEKNKGCCLLIQTTNGAKLLEIDEPTHTRAINELNDSLNSFRSYKRVEVIAKNNTKTPWKNGFTWQLDFDREESKQIAGTSNSGGIGALDFIDRIGGMMEKNFELQKQVLQKDLAISNNDPAKWIPLIQQIPHVLGALGYGVAAAYGISGPPVTPQKKDLQFGDVENLTPQQIGVKVGETLDSIATKISGSQMLQFISAIDANPDLKSNIDTLTKVMNAVNDKPEYLVMASNMFK